MTELSEFVNIAVKAALAANNAEWVKFIENLIIGCDGGYGPDCRDKPIILDINLDQWQARKREVSK